MKVIYGIGQVKKAFKNTVLAIGVFDGLHIGHQRLIKKAVKKARASGGSAVVMTFSPHPVQVLHPDDYLPFVVSLPYRLKLIERLGVMACVVVHFTKRFSRLSAPVFVQKYIVERIRPVEIFIGSDFRFGKDRRGTIEYFMEAGHVHGFKVNAIPTVKRGDKKIGSSLIRRLITEGQLARAKKYLNREVAVMGRVIRGDGRGKTLGYPTANIAFGNAVTPPVGVYAVRAQIDGNNYSAMANIGHKPSFQKNIANPVSLEVHLFDFNGNLYGKELTVAFIKKIRTERFFPSQEKLIAQLKRDERRVKGLLKNS